MASSPRHQEKLNGQDAAALIAAGVGILALGLVTPVGAWMVASRAWGYHVVRPWLTAGAFVLWGVLWFVLRQRWRERTLPAKATVLRAALLVLLGLLLGAPTLAWFWPGFPLP